MKSQEPLMRVRALLTLNLTNRVVESCYSYQQRNVTPTILDTLWSTANRSSSIAWLQQLPCEGRKPSTGFRQSQYWLDVEVTAYYTFLNYWYQQSIIGNHNQLYYTNWQPQHLTNNKSCTRNIDRLEPEGYHTARRMHMILTSRAQW